MNSPEEKAAEKAPPAADTLTGTIARYASSSAFKQLLGVVNAFLKPKLLAPELLGLWSLLTLIPNYVPYARLGSFTALRYRIPANLARGDDQRNTELQGTAFWGTLFLCGLLSLGLMVLAVTLDLTTPERTGLLTMSLVVLLVWYFDYQVSLLKAYQEFKLLSNVNYFQAITLSLLNVALILVFGIYGLYAALIISMLAAIVYIRCRYRSVRPGPYRHAIFLGLVKTGFPIMFYSLGAMLIRTSDKLIISAFLGLESLGYYAIAGMVFNFLMHVPGAARDVIEPKLIYRLEGESQRLVVEDCLEKPLLGTAYFMLLLIGPGVLLLPDFVAWLLPRYSEGVQAAQILLWGGYFLALSHILRGIIVAKNMQVAAIKLMCVVLVFNLALSLLLLKLGMGLSGVALASSLSFLLLFLSQWQLIRHKLGRSVVQLGVMIPCVPFAAAATFWFILSWMMSVTGLSTYVTLPVAVLIYTIFALLLYNRAADRYGYFSRLRLRIPQLAK